MCNRCTLSNKIDLNNLHSAICEACEKEDKNIFKQIEAALRSKPAPEDRWKCVFCKQINVIEWDRLGSSVCKQCNEKDFTVKNKIEVKLKGSSKKSCTKCNAVISSSSNECERCLAKKVECLTCKKPGKRTECE